MQVYYMMEEYGANYKMYENRLVKLGMYLNQLAYVSQVIWLNQYPTVEFYAKMHARNTDIHTEKINHYNKVVQRILK